MASTLYPTSNGSSMVPLVSIPHVYVYPPEEEMEGPWLCFDAHNPHLDLYHEFENGYGVSHLHYDDEEEDVDEYADLNGTFEPPELAQEHYESTRQLVDTLLHGFSDGETQDVVTSRRGTYDEDENEQVVEVVKVGRDSSDENAPPSSKSSNKGGSIFSRAFKSLKNVGKKSKQPEEGVEQPTSTPPTPTTIASAPVIARRPSILSRRRSRSNSQAPSIRSSKSVDQGMSDFGETPRSVSPSPSDFTSKPANRRFSMLSLNKLFRSSQVSLHQKQQTDDQLTDSTISSAPGTPLNAAFAFDSNPKPAPAISFDDPADISGEMMLDSLHFSELSFDVDNFH